MGRFVETVNDWSKGDWGELGAYRAGLTDDGFFKATNMVVYADGSIGPRVGLKELAHTSVPANPIRAWGYCAVTKSSITGWILFVVGNTVYRAPAFEAGAVVTIGTLAGTETEFCSAKPILSEGNVYFATRNQGVYKWAVTADTITQINTLTGLYDLVRYKDRLYASQLRRVYYSDAADFDTWTTATGYFDVGWQFANYRMGSLRNALYFFRQGGGHYVLTGVPESTSTLRETGAGLPPDEHSATVVTADDSAVWIPQARQAPVYFRGGIVDTDRWGHLEDWSTSTTGFRAGAYSFGPKTTVFNGTLDNKALLHHNDVWTKHEWSVDAQQVTRAGDDKFAFTDLGATSTAAKFWLWDFDQDQPGKVGEDYPPGDASTTPVTAHLYLPEWWSPQGEDVIVREVEVEFVSYDTDTDATCHFDLVVRAMRPKVIPDDVSAVGYRDSQTYDFDEATSASAAAGTERRIAFNVGDQGWGRGYQIRLSAIRNVSIRSVTAVVDTEKRDSR